MQDVRVADAVHSKQTQRVVPLAIIANIIDSITQLNAKIILSSQLCGDPAHAFQRGLLLNISQQEELGLLCGRSRLETVDLGPDRAVTHTEEVGRVILQAGQRNGIHAVDLLAGGIGDQLGGTRHLSSTAHVGAGGKLHRGTIGTESGIAHPSDSLSVLRPCQIEADVIGCTGLVTHSVITGERDLIRAISLCVSRAQFHLTLLSHQITEVDLTVFIGRTLQHVVGIHADARGGLVILNNSNERSDLTARHSSVSLNAVHGLNGVIHQLGGKAGSILVYLADVKPLGLLAAVRTSGDAYIDAVALDHRGGDIQQHSGQPVSLEGGMIDGGDINRHHTLGIVIAVCTGNAIREGHRGGIAAGNGDIGRQRSDAGGITAGQCHLPLAAYRGCADSIQLNRGQLRVIGHYIKIARLAGHVAVTVLQIKGDGVHTLAEMHQRGGAAQNILGEGAAIDTVKIEICGLYAGGEGIGILIIVIGNKEPQIAGVDRHAVLQFGLGTVVIDQLDRVHHGRSDVLIVGTIDDAEVVQQDPAFQGTLIQLDAICSVPADAAGSGHGTEEHTAVGADQRTGILGQVGLQILPAGFESLTFSRAAAAEVDIRRCPTCTTIGAGGDLRTQPGNRHALGNINPNAKRGRCTIDGQIVAQAKASAIRSGKSRPIILQLDRLMAEADNIGKFFIRVGHYRSLDYSAAASIVVGCHCIGCHTRKAFHGIADSRVIPRILVAAVQNHQRCHTNF